MMNKPKTVKSLSLNRKTQTSPRKEELPESMITEEDQALVMDIETAFDSPIARTSCFASTPNKKIIDTPEDSPDQFYCRSPLLLFPPTQDSTEIGWDWNYAVKKNDDSSSGGKLLDGTPKRPQQFSHKKRTAKSYSPLLNKQSKRKLYKKLNAEAAKGIEQFAKELKALADDIRIQQNVASAEKTEGNSAAREIPRKIDSPSSAIFDMETQNAFDIHDVSTLEVSDNPEEKSDREKPNSSLDDFFDDGIDAYMVECSQKIENKLKMNSETAVTKSVVILPHGDEGGMQTTGCLTSRNSTNRLPDVKSLSTESRIADDSMDDCLALCVDVDDSMSKETAETTGHGTRSCSYNRNIDTQSRPVNIPNKHDSSDGKEKSAQLKLKEQSRSKEPPICPKFMLLNDITESDLDDSLDDHLLEIEFQLFSETADTKSAASSSSDDGNSVLKIGCGTSKGPGEPSLGRISHPNNQVPNIDPISKAKQQCTGSATQPTFAQNRKYFKAKSLSDSFCANSILVENEQALHSDMNSNSKGQSQRCPIKNSVSNIAATLSSKANGIHSKGNSTPNLNNCIPAAGSRNNSSNNKVSFSYLKTSRDELASNTTTGSDPYSLRRTVPINSPQWQYKPEEIERKRLQAKLRLEANKLKKKIYSK